MKKINKDILSKLYDEKKNKEICKELEITSNTLINYLKFYKIKLKGKGNRFSRTKIELN